MNYDFPHLIISYTKQSKEIFFRLFEANQSVEANKWVGFFLLSIIVSILTIVTLKTNNIVMTMRKSTLTQAGENKLPTNKPLKVLVCVSLMKYQYFNLSISIYL